MANQFLFANFFATELIAPVQVTDTVLSIPPDAAQALQNFTSGFYAPLTLWDGQNPPEIVWCISNDQTGQLIVLRGQEGTSPFAWAAGTQVISSLTAAVINAALLAYNTGLILMANYLPLAGGTLTGPLTLAGNPTIPLHAANKGYVDAITTGFMPTSGGVFTGDVSMNGHRLLSLPTPVVGSEAAPKSYVDSVTSNTANYVLDTSGIYLSAGSGSSYVVTTSGTRYSGGLPDGLKIAFRLHASMRSSATLIVDGNPAWPIRWAALNDVVGGQLVVGQIITVEYHAAQPEWIIVDAAKDFQLQDAGGGPNAYTLTTGYGFVALDGHMVIQVIFPSTNAGAVTLNIDGLGAVPVRVSTGVDLVAGQLAAHSSMLMRYSSSTNEWIILGLRSALANAGDVSIANLAVGQALVWNGTQWVNYGSAPVPSTLLSGAAATYTTPTDANGNRPAYLEVVMSGAGAGGGAETTNQGVDGGATSFGSWTALGGLGGKVGGSGSNQPGGAGGTGGANGPGVQIMRLPGGAGEPCQGQLVSAGGGINYFWAGGNGGFNIFAGPGLGRAGQAGGDAVPNTGAGGAGGGLSQQSNACSASGGGSGEVVRFIIYAPDASYVYTIGAGGTGGAAGVVAGGDGADGRIEIVARWQ